MIRKLAAVVCLLVYFVGVAWSAAPAPPTYSLDTILLDLDDAPFSTVKKVAELQAKMQYQTDKGPLYKSCPKRENSEKTVLSDEVFFEGTIVARTGKSQLALFSDDGCDVWINDQLVLDNFAKGQHLPNLAQSLHVIDYKFVPNRSYKVKIHYANTVYNGKTDIDGCTLFAFSGGVDVAEPGFRLVILPKGPARPDPVHLGHMTAVSFDVSLTKGEKNKKEAVGAGSEVEAQEYQISAQKGTNGGQIQAIRIGGHQAEVNGDAVAGFQTEFADDSHRVILRRKGPIAESSFTVELLIWYETAGKKSVAMTGSALFKGGVVATSPRTPVEQPAQINLNVLAQAQEDRVRDVVKTEGGKAEKLPDDGKAQFKIGDAALEGTVKVLTGVSCTTASDAKLENTIQLEFSGKLQQDYSPFNTGWLQFVYISQFKDNKELTGSVAIERFAIGRGFIPLGKDKWTVDSSSDNNPFYDSKNAFHREKTSLAIFDAPSIPKAVTDNKEFDKQVFVFESFFTYRQRVVYNVHWERHFEFKDGKWQPPVYTNIKGKVVAQLSDVMPAELAKGKTFPGVFRSRTPPNDRNGKLGNQTAYPNDIKNP